MNGIRRLLRGAFLISAVAIGAAMLSATPSQATSDEEGCNLIEALDFQTGELVECYYCQNGDSGNCRFGCENGSVGEFPCSPDEFN